MCSGKVIQIISFFVFCFFVFCLFFFFFFFFTPYYGLHYIKNLTKKDNSFVMLQVLVYNSLQIRIIQKILHTSIISESIKFLVKKY